MRWRVLRRQKLGAPAAAGDSLLRRAAGPALIGALALLFFGRALFTGEVLLPAAYLSHFQPWQSEAPPAPEHWNALAWDAMAQYYPWRKFAHDSLARGIIPLWNPCQFCGTPFVANHQSALFYPLNIVFWIMDPGRAFAVGAALHLFLAGVFTYLFLCALGLGRFGATFGGITFAFCGFLTAWVHLPTISCTAAWLPLALFCVERFFAQPRARYIIGLGFAIGTALLAGHPQMFLFVAGTTALYFTFRTLCPGERLARRLALGIGGAAAAGLLALLWSGVQLLPTAELLPYSHRATAPGAPGYAAYLRFAMPWQQLITLLLPEFMGNPAYGTYWGRGNLAEYAAYIGAVPLALAVLAVIWKRDLRAVFFAAAAGLALLAALGTPVNRALFYLVPGFSSMGGPGRMLFIYSASAAFLSGMGADAASRALADSAAARRCARHLALAALVLIISAALFATAVAMTLDVAVGELLAAPALNIVVMLLALSAGAAAYWAGSRERGRAQSTALAVLLMVSVFDLFAFGARYYRTAPPQAVYPPTSLTTHLQQRVGLARVMPLYQSWGLTEFPRAVLPPNSAMVYGLYDVQGYDSLYLARYRSVLAAVQGRDPSPLANGNMLLGAPCDPALLAALSVEYVLSPAPLDLPGLALERAGEVNLYRVENFVPRAYITRRVECARDLRESLARLRCASEGAVVLETAQARAAPRASGVRRNSVTVLGYDLNRVRLKAWRSGYLALSDAYYPGWRAWVEGKPAPIYIANGAFRAVPIAPGEHEVELRFEPTSLRLGLFATLVAAAIGAAALGTGAAARRRR